MTNALLEVVATIITIYWIGDKAKQNAKLDTLVSTVESGYGSLNARLRKSSITVGLAALQKVYLYLMVGSIIIFFSLNRFFDISGEKQIILIWMMCIPSILWMSIKWYTNHKAVLKESIKPFLMVTLSPFLLLILGYLADEPIINALVNDFRQVELPFGWSIPEVINPLHVVLWISFGMAVASVFYYVVACIVFLPAVLLSFLCVAMPIQFAKIVNSYCPKTPLIGFTVFLYVAIRIVQYLNN